MAIMYQGKKPGKAWYFWQNLKLAGKSLFNKTTSQKAKQMGKSSGFAAGSLIVGGAISHYLFLMPFMTIIGGVGGLAGAAYFGYRASQTFKQIKSSSFGRDYIYEQEKKWQLNKSKGPFLQRLVTSIKIGTNKIGRFIGFTGMAGGFAAAVVGGLHLAGVPGLAAIAQAMAALPLAAGITAAAALPVAIGIAAVTTVAALFGVRKCNNNLSALRGNAPARSSNKSFMSPALRQKLDAFEKGQTSDFNNAATPSQSNTAPESNDNDIIRRLAERARRFK